MRCGRRNIDWCYDRFQRVQQIATLLFIGKALTSVRKLRTFVLYLGITLHLELWYTVVLQHALRPSGNNIRWLNNIHISRVVRLRFIHQYILKRLTHSVWVWAEQMPAHTILLDTPTNDWCVMADQAVTPRKPSWKAYTSISSLLHCIIEAKLNSSRKRYLSMLHYLFGVFFLVLEPTTVGKLKDSIEKNIRLFIQQRVQNSLV